jgi:serine/threonine protein kinase
MSEMSWIGRTLSGRYKIEEMLGQGGMSAVYRAQDPNLRRVVAVKLIHSHLSDNPDFVRRFEEEATAVARLRHNNIIQVYDFNHDGSTFYIVFEFIPGETLQDWLRRLNQEKRLMPLDDAIRIAATTAEALEFAHQQGLIHRDVKPANVMINVRGEPILMDFGIAKIVGGTQHTATGAVLGTARYMSPEQVKGERVDARTDLYALGVMLFEMLGGRAPYQSDSVMTMMMMHVQDPIPNVLDLRPDVPPHVVAVLNRALAKRPEERFATAGEMAAALRNPQALPMVAPTLLVTATDVSTMVAPQETIQSAAATMAATVVSAATSTTNAAVASAMPPAPPPPPPIGAGNTAVSTPNGKRNKLIAAGVGILLLLLLFGGAYAFWPSATPPETAVDTSATATVLAEAETVTALLATDIAQTEAAVAPTATATTQPEPTVADSSPTPSPTPFPEVEITNVTMVGDVYVVQYSTVGFTETPDGMHLHFFFDTTPAREAGRPFSDFFMYMGPSPYTELLVSDRPAGATQLCALVANPDHTVQGESGNCFALPEESSSNTAVTDQPAPSPTATSAPVVVAASPTPAPATPSVTISGIREEGGVYLVDYSTTGFTESMAGMHIHFFFNSVPPQNAGLPYGGPWFVWGGPRPFNGYTTSDRPANATQLCALVANPDHTVQQGTGNCVALP